MRISKFSFHKLTEASAHLAQALAKHFGSKCQMEVDTFIFYPEE
jgi:hypothetical protein